MSEFAEISAVQDYFCAVCNEKDFCESPPCEKLQGLMDLYTIDITYCKDCGHYKDETMYCPFWHQGYTKEKYDFCHLGKSKNEMIVERTEYYES